MKYDYASEHPSQPGNQIGFYLEKNKSRRKFFQKMGDRLAIMGVIFQVALGTQLVWQLIFANPVSGKDLACTRPELSNNNSNKNPLKNCDRNLIEGIPYGLIQAEAYKLWRLRGEKTGSPTYRDWYAALENLKAKRSQNQKDLALQRGRQNLIAWAIVALFGAIVVEVIKSQLNRQHLKTDFLVKAVEQLASEKITVRLGGMYGLEKMMFDRAFHWQSKQILTAYIREKSPLAKKKSKSERSDSLQVAALEIDIQIAMEIIAKQKLGRDRQEEKINLSKTQLSGLVLDRPLLKFADLTSTNLTGADLRGANLSDASLNDAKLIRIDLSEANLINTKLITADLSSANLIDAKMLSADLRGANLIDANLIRANLSDANLTDAQGIRVNLSGAKLIRADLTCGDLSGADLIETDLSNSNLSSTYLIGADLTAANLSHANLTKANLTNANLKKADLSGVYGLSVAQIKKAKNWFEAIYSDEFRQKLSLSENKNVPTAINSAKDPILDRA